MKSKRLNPGEKVVILIFVIIWAVFSIFYIAKLVQVYQYHHYDKTEYTQAAVTIDECWKEEEGSGRGMTSSYYASFHYYVAGKDYYEDHYFVHYDSIGYKAPGSGDCLSVIYKNSDPEILLVNRDAEAQDTVFGTPWWGTWLGFTIVIILFVIGLFIVYSPKEKK